MALVRVVERPLGESLASPIDHRHGKAARPGLADHFEIFLDELRPAGQDQQRALAPLRRSPAREAQRDAIRGLEDPRDRALRDGVRGNGDERHQGCWFEAGSAPL